MERLTLASLFVLLNMLDLFSTWLNLFNLPLYLRGTEMNFLWGDLNKHWNRAVYVKLGVTAFLTWLAWTAIPTSQWILIDIIIGLVVANNFYIYLYKRSKNRAPMTIGRLFLEVWHLPKTLAFILVVVLLGGIMYGLGAVIK